MEIIYKIQMISRPAMSAMKESMRALWEEIGSGPHIVYSDPLCWDVHCKRLISGVHEAYKPCLMVLWRENESTFCTSVSTYQELQARNVHSAEVICNRQDVTRVMNGLVLTCHKNWWPVPDDWTLDSLKESASDRNSDSPVGRGMCNYMHEGVPGAGICVAFRSTGYTMLTAPKQGLVLPPATKLNFGSVITTGDNVKPKIVGVEMCSGLNYPAGHPSTLSELYSAFSISFFNRSTTDVLVAKMQSMVDESGLFEGKNAFQMEPETIALCVKVKTIREISYIKLGWFTKGESDMGWFTLLDASCMGLQLQRLRIQGSEIEEDRVSRLHNECEYFIAGKGNVAVTHDGMRYCTKLRDAEDTDVRMRYVLDKEMYVQIVQMLAKETWPAKTTAPLPGLPAANRDKDEMSDKKHGVAGEYADLLRSVQYGVRSAADVLSFVRQGESRAGAAGGAASGAVSSDDAPLLGGPSKKPRKALPPRAQCCTKNMKNDTAWVQVCTGCVMPSAFEGGNPKITFARAEDGSPVNSLNFHPEDGADLEAFYRSLFPSLFPQTGGTLEVNERTIQKFEEAKHITFGNGVQPEIVKYEGKQCVACQRLAGAGAKPIMTGGRASHCIRFSLCHPAMDIVRQCFDHYFRNARDQLAIETGRTATEAADAGT